MYKKSDIKVGNYVRLGKKPFGDSRQTLDEMLTSSLQFMEDLKKNLHHKDN